ncbi:hypothetical protein KAJ83_05825 [Marivibrio halodurans]|uniref:Uncharacterized protein n=1 Tax=Marivibrio halodurans TaxID=2039722 RepID=A0A8J7V085_9PROT|nr:hypothetical protein [Marivibrio halodurans]MBP5856516.1 hypothetical protein [Marivibrio halodurans]
MLEDEQTVVDQTAEAAIIESTVFGRLKQPRAFSNPRTWSGAVASKLSVDMEGNLDALFPLEVGKTVSARGTSHYKGRSSPFERTCVVEDQLKITVPAGAFDTFKVDCRIRFRQGGYTVTFWYAPSIHHFAAFSDHGIFLLLDYRLAEN